MLFKDNNYSSNQPVTFQENLAREGGTLGMLLRI